MARPRSLRIVPLIVVAAVAGGCAGSAALHTASTGSPAGEVDAAPGVVTLSSFQIEPAKLTVRAGNPYVIKVRNTDTTGHTFEVEGIPAVGIGIAPGGEADVMLPPLAPGSFVFYCGVDDHRQRGMVGALEVVQ